MKKILLLLVLLLLVGCANSYNNVVNNNPETQVIQENDLSTPGVENFTMAEIALHNKKGDCWLLIDGKVYDVSNFDTHPGGEAILAGCGLDATQLFETRPMGSMTPHSDKAREKMQEFYIGDLQ